MKIKLFNSSARLLLLCIACTGAFAASAGDLSDPEFRTEVAEQFPGVSPENITPTPLAGIYQISQGGVVGYISADGRYLMNGDLIDLDSNENLAETARGQWRLKQLAGVDDSDMLVFSPQNPKHTITVFTDLDCAYCRLMHQQLDKFMQAGIRVRYLFFPLDGPGSQSYQKAQAVWCSEDPKAALTRAKNGKDINSTTDCDNPVDAQFALAWDTLKLRGTPSLFTEDGRMLQLTNPVDGVIQRITGE